MKNFVVGLTGGIGSGKTTVANMFNDLGVELVDADIIARQVVEPGSFALNEIKKHFGKDYIQADGCLDRAKLRQKVFSSELDKQWLNQLLHPLIRESMLDGIAKSSSPYCILVAPLLLENNLTKYVDRTLVVDVSSSIQMERTIKRDNSNIAVIKKIIDSQISQKERLQRADDIIDNSGNNLDRVKDQVTNLHNIYSNFTKSSF